MKIPETFCSFWYQWEISILGLKRVITSCNSVKSIKSIKRVNACATLLSFLSICVEYEILAEIPGFKSFSRKSKSLWLFYPLPLPSIWTIRVAWFGYTFEVKKDCTRDSQIHPFFRISSIYTVLSMREGEKVSKFECFPSLLTFVSKMGKHF